MFFYVIILTTRTALNHSAISPFFIFSVLSFCILKGLLFLMTNPKIIEKIWPIFAFRAGKKTFSGLQPKYEN